jgi:large subunit ribosomal protein L9
MEVILLERVAKLGHMGETVRVKDGYARNFLLPRHKALRATEANKKKFEEQRHELEERNAKSKSDAATKSAKLDGQSYVIIRQAGETGQLYGSVSARDLAEVITASAKHAVHHNHIALNLPIKNLGLHQVTVHLHPEVEAHVTINVARSPEQAERQAKGEDLTVRETTSMDDLGLEVGRALAEAGPGESLGRE